MSRLRCLVLDICALFVWAFVVHSVTAPVWLIPSEADLKPTDPIFEEGETIVLNCTLLERHNGTRNASLLAFKHNAKTYGSKYITLLSEDTAQFRLPNASVEHYGHFVCYLLPNISLGMRASQHVHVARRPLKPVLQTCRVHNWEFLECSWTPSKGEQKDYSSSSRLQSEVFWHVQGHELNICRNSSEENNFKLQSFSTSSNFGTGNRSCMFQMGENYCLQVEVTNTLPTHVRSDKVCINTSGIVWPNPPKVTEGYLLDDGKSIVVRWNPPSSSFSYDPQQLTYALDYKSNWDQRNTSIAELKVVTSVTLPGNPFTMYTVWLRVKPLSSGFWSNATTFQFRTSERAPYQQPVLNPRGFFISSHDGVNRNVIIYWKPVLPERFNGRDFHYIASVKSSAVWETLNNRRTTDTFLELQLKPEVTDVRIVAENGVGSCTAPQEPVRIASFSSGLPRKSPVYEVVVEHDTKNFSYALISWTYIPEPIGVTGITIFWCSSSLLFTDFAHCKPSIEWKELNISQQQYNVTFPSNLYSIQEKNELRAGISVDLNGFPCGIKWSTSLYALDKVAPPPQNVQAVIPHGSDHGNVYVTWEKPECVMSPPCGHANEFLLVYCLVSYAGNEACIDRNHSVTISSQKFAYNLTGLDVGSNYKLWMLSLSKAGFSAESNAVYTATTKPWKTAGAIVGLAFGSLIILFVVVFGFYGSFRYCNKYKKKITRGVEVVMPKSVSVQQAAKTSTSSRSEILYNSYPGGYSRQGSDMSSLSRDSGRFSFTQTCGPTSNQQLSPLVYKSNGTLVPSVIVPLIGIQEDANADDVFPDVQGFDGNSYVKTTVIDDPDDNTGYKVNRPVNYYRVNGDAFRHVVPEIQYKKPADVASVSSAKPRSTSLQDVGVYSRPDILLCAAGDPNNGAYIRIQPDAAAAAAAPAAADVDLFCLPTAVSDKSAPSLPPPVLLPPPPLPPPVSDISYTTVEVLDPNLSFPVSAGPGVDGGGGNDLENGYTDISFLTNNFLGNNSQANCNHGRTTADARPAQPTDAVASADATDGELSQNVSHLFNSSRTDLSCGQLLTCVTDCVEGVVSSDPSYACIGSNLDCDPLTNVTLTHPLSVTVAGGDPDDENARENCLSIIPSGAALCDNGYVYHRDMFNTMLTM